MRNLLFAAAATVLALMGMASCSSKPSVDYPEAMLIDTAAYHTVFNAFVNGDEETLREFIGGDDHSKCRDVEYSSEEWKRTADSHGGVERYELVDEHSRISHPDAVQDTRSYFWVQFYFKDGSKQKVQFELTNRKLNEGIDTDKWMFTHVNKFRVE